MKSPAARVAPLLCLLPLLVLSAPQAPCQEPPPVQPAAPGAPEEMPPGAPDERPAGTEGKRPEAPAGEQRPKPGGDWSNVATLSYVSASGNSSANTLGCSNDFTRKWGLHALVLKCGMIRSISTTSTFSAVGGSLDDVVVRESKVSSVTAENFYANARFDYRLKDKRRWYWYCGARWERNWPVGLDARTAVTVGAGRIVVDMDATKLRLDFGGGVTREDPVVRPDAFRRDFGTFNLTSELKQRIAPAVGYSADLSAAYDIKQAGGWLVSLKNGLTAAVRKKIALKVGADLNYRSDPPLISVAAHTGGDPPVSLGVVHIRAKRLDTVTTISLVITF